MSVLEPVYYVTTVSNFARGYDKYQRIYSKQGVPESTFPGRFYVLREDELEIGVRKSTPLLEKLNLPGNRLLVLRAELATSQLHPNTRTGLGRYVESGELPVDAVFTLAHGTSGQPQLRPYSVEDAYAESLRLLTPQLKSWEELRPRSVSVLPMARACQASCAFCFSHASVSTDQIQDQIDFEQLEQTLWEGKWRGAERMVITGGGEPGLVPQARLLRMIETGARILGKVVLITNGHFLGKLTPEARILRLDQLAEAGLSYIAISRHHHNNAVNERIMKLNANVEAVTATWRQHRLLKTGHLKMRFICVLQRGGVEDMDSLRSYLTWASSLGVGEVCFKELYVASTLESAYAGAEANIYSRHHQVPLSLVLQFAREHGFTQESELPWGAPIFQGEWNGRAMRIAAYTEPSVFWERSTGIARSWNIMADNRCLASLEAPESAVALPWKTPIRETLAA